MAHANNSIQVIPVINNKGGVGKTTTSINLAAGLGRSGARVLMMDLDSQGSASLALGVERNDERPSSAAVLFGEAPVEAAIRSLEGPGFDLIPGTLPLADAGVRLAPMQNRERRLETILEPLRSRYDVILLDCPPSTSLLAINVVIAADAFLIPLLPSYLGLEGIISLGEVISKARQNLGYVAPVLGIVLTMVNYDQEGTQEIIHQVRTHYGDKVFDTEIGTDVNLEDAPGYNQTIFEYDEDCAGAQAYEKLTHEVIQRLRPSQEEDEQQPVSQESEAPERQTAAGARAAAAAAGSQDRTESPADVAAAVAGEQSLSASRS